MRQGNQDCQIGGSLAPPSPGGCAPQTPSRIGRLGSAKLRGEVGVWVIAGILAILLGVWGVVELLHTASELDSLRNSLGGCSLQVDTKSPSPYRFLSCPQAPFEKVYINQGFGPAPDTLAFQSKQACEMFETPTMDGKGTLTYTVECDKPSPTPQPQPAPARIEPTPEPQKFIDKRRRK